MRPNLLILLVLSGVATHAIAHDEFVGARKVKYSSSEHSPPHEVRCDDSDIFRLCSAAYVIFKGPSSGEFYLMFNEGFSDYPRYWGHQAPIKLKKGTLVGPVNILYQEIELKEPDGSLKKHLLCMKMVDINGKDRPQMKYKEAGAGVTCSTVLGGSHRGAIH